MVDLYLSIKVVSLQETALLSKQSRKRIMVLCCVMESAKSASMCDEPMLDNQKGGFVLKLVKKSVQKKHTIIHNDVNDTKALVQTSKLHISLQSQILQEKMKVHKSSVRFPAEHYAVYGSVIWLSLQMEKTLKIILCSHVVSWKNSEPP